MSYLIFYFQIYFQFLHFFKLFEHSKYKIIHKFENLWHFDRFRNCKILEIFGIFQDEYFWNFPNGKF